MKEQALEERILSIAASSSQYVFNKAGTAFISVSALSENKAVIVYTDENNQGMIIIATISGDEIIYSQSHIFNQSSTCCTSVTALSETQALIAYTDYSDVHHRGIAFIATISEYTIEGSERRVFNEEGTYETSVIALSGTKVMIAFRDEGYSVGFGVAILATISEDKTSFSSKRVFNAAETDDIYVIALSEIKALFMFIDTKKARYVMRTGTIIDDTIVYAPKTFFNVEDKYYLSAASLSKTQSLVVYRDKKSRAGMMHLATNSDDAVLYSMSHVFNNSSTSFAAIIALSKTRAMVAFRDDVASGQGAAIIVKILREEKK